MLFFKESPPRAFLFLFRKNGKSDLKKRTVVYLMTIELAVLISIISVSFAVFSGVMNLRRNNKCDDKKDASQMTTVIVKLENIGSGISEIKSEMRNVKSDIQETREKLAKVEEWTRQAHRRIDACEKFCKRLPENHE